MTDAEMHNARERRRGLTSVIRRKRSGPGLHALWLALGLAALLGVRWAAAPRRPCHCRPPSSPRARAGLAWRPPPAAMTPEMRYLLDLNGYLHLRSVLSSRELSACRAAADRHVALCAADLTRFLGFVTINT